MRALRAIARSAAAPALVSCTTHRAASRPTARAAVARQPVPALPTPTATTDPELSLDRGHLDPHFRSFRTATATAAARPSDGTEITKLVQHHHP
ncbi:hypothetical protein [Nonomuraea sp. NPDC050783]|uniref:hypothetical protein n=1 Tax=Nonomuraea sp. NPDC050783 TaxID=3154634 RepID=UPI0034653874